MLRWCILPEQQEKRDKQAKLAKDKEEAAKKSKGKREGKGEKTPKAEKKDRHVKDSEKEKEEYTPEELMKKVTEIAGQRGRRGFDRKAYLQALQKLLEHAEK